MVSCLYISFLLPVQKTVLFLGAAVYWGGISPEVKQYIRTMDKNMIGKVAVFFTSSLAQRASVDTEGKEGLLSLMIIFIEGAVSGSLPWAAK